MYMHIYIICICICICRCSTTYMFWILNDTEPADQATKAKLYNNQLKFQQVPG